MEKLFIERQSVLPFYFYFQQVHSHCQVDTPLIGMLQNAASKNILCGEALFHTSFTPPTPPPVK